jgi:hypothetical protein
MVRLFSYSLSNDMNSPNWTRRTVNFRPHEWQLLDRVAKDKGVTRHQLMRGAILALLPQVETPSRAV